MNEFMQELWGTIFLGVVAYIILWIAWRKQFFHLPNQDKIATSLSLAHVVAVFAIYFSSVIFFIFPLQVAWKTLFHWLGISQYSLYFSVVVHFSLSLFIACLLLLFYKMITPQVQKVVWHKNLKRENYFQDICLGLLSWPISYPLVLFIGQLFTLIIYWLFNVKELPDQTAVHFLKMTMNQPFSFLLNTLSIAVLAPFIEEFIFRGFLQTYTRKFFQPIGAISLTSFCFACFHFNPDQGLGNIPIISSLWAFSLFLGFVYERQGSLFAPIILHAIFNILSVLNIYFLGGIPQGAW